MLTGVIITLFGISGAFFLFLGHFVFILLNYPLITYFTKTYFNINLSLFIYLFGPPVYILIYYAIMVMINNIFHRISKNHYLYTFLSSPFCYYFALKILSTDNTSLNIPLNCLYIEIHLPATFKIKKNPYLKDALVNDINSYIQFLRKVKIFRSATVYTYTPLAVRGLLKLTNTDSNISCISTPTLIDPEKALTVRLTKKKWHFYTITFSKK